MLKHVNLKNLRKKIWSYVHYIKKQKFVHIFCNLCKVILIYLHKFLLVNMFVMFDIHWFFKNLLKCTSKQSEIGSYAPRAQYANHALWPTSPHNPTPASPQHPMQTPSPPMPKREPPATVSPPPFRIPSQSPSCTTTSTATATAGDPLCWRPSHALLPFPPLGSSCRGACVRTWSNWSSWSIERETRDSVENVSIMKI